MIDWAKSMEQTFEYYVVDPYTWKETKKLDNVLSSSITRDSKSSTLENARIDVVGEMNECYIRIYLIAIQDKEKTKVPLGTFLVQTPSMTFDGKIKKVSLDAYSPLLELTENPVDLGYSLLEGENIMENACRIVKTRLRTPVIDTSDDKQLYSDFVSNPDDTWLAFVIDLSSNAKYELCMDELSRVLFSPIQDTAALQPVWTYNDDNSSILLPNMSLERDIYKIPNVVEVVYSSGKDYYYARVINDDPNSPLSTVSRGREIIKRVTNPSSLGDPTQRQIDEFAKDLLKSLSTVEYTISYSHGYCPVRVGDCVRLNFKNAGIVNVKAKVTSQTIDCKPGMKVNETSVFTEKLWGD